MYCMYNMHFMYNIVYYTYILIHIFDLKIYLDFQF
jgi:hypothetical protein